MMGGQVTKLTDYERAVKANDIWILRKRGKAVLRVGHRATEALEFEVPLSAVEMTIRRASGLTKLDVSSRSGHGEIPMT